MLAALGVRAAAAAACLAVALASTAARGADDLDARRREIAALSPADQQELLRKQERFLALPAAEQDRLRALQTAVDADIKSARLQQVLTGYHEWLKTLSPSERAELSELPPAERVERIEKIVERQQRARVHAQRVELLTSRDMRNILSWIEDILWRHREELLKDMSPRMRKWFEQENEERQRRALVQAAIYRSRREGGGKNRVDIDQQDVRRLYDRLSEQAKAELVKQPDLEAQRRLVGGWIFSSMIERTDSGRPSRPGAPLPEAEVSQFFEQELSARKRDELMNLPADKAREELRRMYWQRQHGGSMFRDGPGGPRFDRRRPDGPDGPPPNRPRGDGKSPPPGDGNARDEDRAHGDEHPKREKRDGKPDAVPPEFEF